ncbi:PQQ-dependent sugar dehydrogenase [Janibacter cremeus]|uniref:Glucose/arabinose dehydrogenase n=1 Tax=Janibacter cremeus TaxID=1285192 RepID=A0A852VUE3_9MICO|nr:PQQ-dependent sugar dehydrogenase [Janibacter cremeus]NYF99020.1 glucose/arabinose dehydrogenase [Janibacter cremeus]
MRRVRRLNTRLWAVLGVSAVAVTVGCSASAPEDEPRGGPAPSSSRSPTSGIDPADPDEPEESGKVSIAETVATDLQTPWDVDFLPGGSALVTLRDSGKVLRLDDEGTTVLDAGGEGGAVPGVQHESEDGLLGLAIGPDGGIYMYLTTKSDNRILRYEMEGDDLVDPEVILEGVPTNENHSGGRLAFGPDGHLYVTTGDARNLDLPQDTSSLAGKILRLTASGEPAPGNPFDNEVFSYGHRNVQGIGWTSDGTMYASEFGSSEYDELNLIEAGGNYGWPHVEGWAEDSDYINPLVTWTTDEASPSGIAVTDEGIWMTALRGERLWHVPIRSDGKLGEPRDHQLNLGRLRAVTAAAGDDLWVVTSNTDGRGDPSASDDRIIRLEVD